MNMQEKEITELRINESEDLSFEIQDTVLRCVSYLDFVGKSPDYSYKVPNIKLGLNTFSQQFKKQVERPMLLGVILASNEGIGTDPGIQTWYTAAMETKKMRRPHHCYFESGDTLFEYPATLSISPLEILIDKSRKFIFSLEENWDDEGASTIQPATFYATAEFLKTYYTFLLSNYQLKIALPEINACNDGTIDLEWHTKEARLLINIKQRNGEYSAFYYGDKYENKMQVKGSVPLNEFSESLAVWMKYLA